MKRNAVLILLLALALSALACGLGEDEDEGTTAGSAPTQEPAGGQPAAPETQEVETAVRPSDGVEMVQIPAGEFLMGDDNSAFAAEKPAHLVALDAYWIDRFEVTNAHYRQCVEAGTCREAKSWSEPELSGDDQPALVPWESADAYCRWAGGRLPTEAEWEKGARGPAGFIWPWGNEFEEGRANLSGPEDGYSATAPVGSYPAGASPYGLHDMAGNAAEWTADWFDRDYYAVSPGRNPTGPAGGDLRASRSSIANAGGGPEKCRAVARYGTQPHWDLGFRCVSPERPAP